MRGCLRLGANSCPAYEKASNYIIQFSLGNHNSNRKLPSMHWGSCDLLQESIVPIFMSIGYLPPF